MSAFTSRLSKFSEVREVHRDVERDQPRKAMSLIARAAPLEARKLERPFSNK